MPSSALAAVAPRQTIKDGSTKVSSASSQGRQALMWLTCGVAWMRRFPRSVKRKVLDGVGDVDILPGHAGFLERLLEQPSRRTDEGNALAILHVTGLLADQG